MNSNFLRNTYAEALRWSRRGYFFRIIIIILFFLISFLFSFLLQTERSNSNLPADDTFTRDPIRNTLGVSRRQFRQVGKQKYVYVHRFHRSSRSMNFVERARMYPRERLCFFCVGKHTRPMATPLRARWPQGIYIYTYIHRNENVFPFDFVRFFCAKKNKQSK